MHHRHIAYKSLLNTEGNLGFKRAELSLDKQVIFSFQLFLCRFNFSQFPSEFGEAMRSIKLIQSAYNYMEINPSGWKLNGRKGHFQYQ